MVAREGRTVALLVAEALESVERVEQASAVEQSVEAKTAVTEATAADVLVELADAPEDTVVAAPAALRVMVAMLEAMQAALEAVTAASEATVVGIRAEKVAPTVARAAALLAVAAVNPGFGKILQARRRMRHIQGLRKYGKHSRSKVRVGVEVGKPELYIIEAS